MKWPTVLLPICLIAASSAADNQFTESGDVEWGRNLDAALKSSTASGKPVFLLFQEIPGCAGCKQFGREVMSDPLIVEAVEDEFVPLLVPNNKEGTDAEVLKRFNEPAWNYQVVRFLGSDGKDLIPRKDKVWNKGPLARRMVSSLEKADRKVPAYLSLIASEATPDLNQVAFAMHCFWTGEAKLGGIDGVITTEAGWIGSHEVTLVTYDASAIPLSKLIKQARAVDCAHTVYLSQDELKSTATGRLEAQALKNYRKAKASDQKRQLQGTPMAALDLTGTQAAKVNAWIRTDRDRALGYLSPRQLRASVKGQ